MTTRTERKKAKLRFALLYSISLLLILVVVSAFWQRLAPGNTRSVSEQSAGDELWFVGMDTTLHSRMKTIDDIADSYVKAHKNGTQPTDTGAWLAARQAMTKTLDSIDQQAGYLSEGPKKSMMTSVSVAFRKALDNRRTLITDLMTMPKAGAAPSDANTAVEMDGLKRSLQEKDATIADLQKQAQLATANSGSANAGLQNSLIQKDKSITSLQNQVTDLQIQIKQKDAALRTASASASRPVDNSGKDKAIATLQSQVTSLQSQLKQKEAELKTASAARPVVTNGGGEWQQKYQSLKSSFDKVASSEKSLKSAYQTLADDNRRLLSQLQSARKG